MFLYSVTASAFFLFAYTVLKGDFVSTFRTSGKNYLISAIMGLLNPFLYYLILFKAYELLPAQIAQSLNYSWAIVLTVLSAVMLKKKMNLRDMTGMMISFLGFLLVVGLFGSSVNEKLNLSGVFLALGSSVFWALFWIMNLKDKRPAHQKLLHSFLFGVLYIIIYLLLMRIKPEINIEGLSASIYIGVFEMSLTFLIWLKALEYSETTAKTANIVFLSPFISLVFISFLLKEAVLWNTVAGLLLIISGIIFQRYEKE